MEYEKIETEATFISGEDVITLIEHLHLGVNITIVNGQEFGVTHPDYERLRLLVVEIIANEVSKQ